jgi:hypothetical protein
MADIVNTGAGTELMHASGLVVVVVLLLWIQK